MGRHWPNGGTLGCPPNISSTLPFRCRLVPPNSSQFYFFTIVSGYGTGQRGDHEKFNSVYSMTGLNSDLGIPRSDPWEARVDPAPRGDTGHSRQESTASDTAMFDNPFDDPPREDVPGGYLVRPTHNQYDEYSAPYNGNGGHH